MTIAFEILLIFHVIISSFAFGLVLVSDVLALHLIKVGRLNYSARKNLPKLSKVILISALLAATSGLTHIVLSYLASDTFIMSNRIISKAVAMCFLLINGFWLHFQIFPWFLRTSGSISKSSKSIFIPWTLLLAGAISGLSWWFIMLIGSFKGAENLLQLPEFLGFYFISLITLVLFSIIAWRAINLRVIRFQFETKSTVPHSLRTKQDQVPKTIRFSLSRLSFQKRKVDVAHVESEVEQSSDYTSGHQRL